LASNHLLSVAEVQHTMANETLTDWDSGLLDCFEDASTCCYGFWCGPCLACTVSGRFGENNCLPLCDIFCGVPIPPAALSVRAAMRNRYGIKGSLCNDIFVSCCCASCSWCQMHRELKHRPFLSVYLLTNHCTVTTTNISHQSYTSRS
uniref:Plac8 onzin related protein 2 n=1 Tax=Amphilophus citrinellus TaxID=61819 RepID=A0A3Q0S432_AMPCI